LKKALSKPTLLPEIISAFQHSIIHFRSETNLRLHKSCKK